MFLEAFLQLFATFLGINLQLFATFLGANLQLFAKYSKCLLQFLHYRPSIHLPKDELSNPNSVFFCVLTLKVQPQSHVDTKNGSYTFRGKIP